MKGEEAAEAHHKAMVALQHEFERKIVYHKQKAYRDPADIYWLAHEFLTAVLQRSGNHHTEEELGDQLKALKHDFISLPDALIDAWKLFLNQLAYAQYGGYGASPDHINLLLEQCSALIEETLCEIVVAPDEITKQMQALRLLIRHGELARAETKYREILSSYEKLPDEHKRSHYKHIANIHKTILDARSVRQASPQ